MMSLTDFEMVRLMSRIECGEFAGLCCYLAIEEDLHALHAEVGSWAAVRAVIDAACTQCGVTPKAPTPLTPSTEVTVVEKPPTPVVVEPPKKQTVGCPEAMPMASDFEAA